MSVDLGYAGSGAYRIAAFLISDDDWYPITTPIACNGWSLRGSVDVHVRSSPTDAASEDDLPAGAQELCDPAVSSYTVDRFPAGSVVVYAKSQAGATTVYGRFVR